MICYNGTNLANGDLLMKKIIAAALIACLFASAPVASIAAPKCRDAKGKFIKCVTPPAPAAAKKCRDAKGKFIKCPA